MSASRACLAVQAEARKSKLRRGLALALAEKEADLKARRKALFAENVVTEKRLRVGRFRTKQGDLCFEDPSAEDRRKAKWRTERLAEFHSIGGSGVPSLGPKRVGSPVSAHED